MGRDQMNIRNPDRALLARLKAQGIGATFSELYRMGLDLLGKTYPDLTHLSPVGEEVKENDGKD